jgi:hypothetical protein
MAVGHEGRKKHDYGHYGLKVCVTADQPCLGEAILEIAHQRMGIVTEQDGAYALVGSCDEDRAQ